MNTSGPPTHSLQSYTICLKCETYTLSPITVLPQSIVSPRFSRLCGPYNEYQIIITFCSPQFACKSPNPPSMRMFALPLPVIKYNMWNIMTGVSQTSHAYTCLHNEVSSGTHPTARRAIELLNR